MAVSTTAIEKIKTLKSDALKIGEFHDWFAKAFADKKHHDKQSFGFNVGQSDYSSFKTSIWFYASAGQFGSSSVYNQLTVNDGKTVGEAFIRALNKHQKLIFQTMSEIMTAEANKLRGEAQKEIAAMQSMLHDLDCPQDVTA